MTHADTPYLSQNINPEGEKSPSTKQNMYFLKNQSQLVTLIGNIANKQQIPPSEFYFQEVDFSTLTVVGLGSLS